MKKIKKMKTSLIVAALIITMVFAGTVLAVTYNENVTINGSLTVNGPDAETPGADADDVLVVSGGAGGDNDSDDAGNGADILITAGDGGDSNSETYCGGIGGDIVLTPGAGGGSPGCGNSPKGNIIMAKDGGYVGIGTDNPSTSLDLDGHARITGNTNIEGNATINGTTVLSGPMLMFDKMSFPGASAILVLPVKTTTGDPASPSEGQIYVNTYDNKVRVYADGAWRDLATW